MFTTTAQLPATAEAESTITTLLDDTTLHEEAATEQTLAEQLWDPAMKLLPYSVTVLPAYAVSGLVVDMFGFVLTFTFKLLLSLRNSFGLLNDISTLQFAAVPSEIKNEISEKDTISQFLAIDSQSCTEQF
jgi:hypothetical protein